MLKANKVAGEEGMMLKAHKVAVYPEDGGGWKWCLYDDGTGDVMHGGSYEPLEWVVSCWVRKYPKPGKVEVEQDGRELRPAEFADLVIAARKAAGAARRRNGKQPEVTEP